MADLAIFPASMFVILAAAIAIVAWLSEGAGHIRVREKRPFTVVKWIGFLFMLLGLYWVIK